MHEYFGNESEDDFEDELNDQKYDLDDDIFFDFEDDEEDIGEIYNKLTEDDLFDEGEDFD
jgi:hypothetical protein